MSLWAWQFPAFMSVVHAVHDWLYLKQPQSLSIFVPPLSGLPLMVGIEAQTRSMLPRVGHWRCTWAWQWLKTCFVHEIDLCEIFECADLKFTVYGYKQASKHTHARTQCSHASVGLAQARPNKYNWLCTLPVSITQTMKSYWFDTSCLEMSYVRTTCIYL